MQSLASGSHKWELDASKWTLRVVYTCKQESDLLRPSRGPTIGHPYIPHDNSAVVADGVYRVLHSKLRAGTARAERGLDVRHISQLNGFAES
ncbi:hypothetical protein SprV_0702249400 [Sparganum proliferum]